MILKKSLEDLINNVAEIKSSQEQQSQTQATIYTAEDKGRLLTLLSKLNNESAINSDTAKAHSISKIIRVLSKLDPNDVDYSTKIAAIIEDIKNNIGSEFSFAHKKVTPELVKAVEELLGKPKAVTPNVEDWSRDVESTAKALEGMKGENVTTRPRLKEDAKSTKPKQLVVSENINNSGDYNYIQKGEKISIQVEEGDAKPNNIIVNTPNRTLNAYEILNAEAAETLRGQTMGSEITDFIYAANGVAKLLGIEPIEIIGQKSKQISEAYHKAKADGSNPECVLACHSARKPCYTSWSRASAGGVASASAIA